MTQNNMTSLQRVLTTLNHKEPDRVPLFLLLTMHGAKELGMTIKEYFSKAENVVEGQLIMRKKYRNDCIVPFFYAAVEVEACGGEVIYVEDGPPNSGRPIILKNKDINSLKFPKIKETPCLMKVLKATEMLKSKIGDDAPIIGTVMSPFSLPIMQMGFEKYLDLLYSDEKLFNLLMDKNQAFCVEWANAQLEAGATAIGYFDPVSSSNIIPSEKYLKTGYLIAKETIAKIKGPTATHFASGRCLPIVDHIVKTGTMVIGTSVDEDLSDMKKACSGKLTILGNLNGIEMRTWTSETAKEKVKEAISKAAKGGGFILADNHGEIPYSVSEEVLLSISDAVHQWGKYPLS